MKKISELTPSEMIRAKDLHEKNVLIDMSIVPKPKHPRIVSGEFFKTLISSGLMAAGISAAGDRNDLGFSMRSLAQWHHIIETNPLVMLATSAEDIQRAREDDRVAIWLAFQDGTPIEEDLNLLLLYYKLGIRVISPTYNDANFLGSGSHEKVDCGLTNMGRKAIEECNRLHMLIDLSHCGDKTTWDTLELSKDPVVFTHANPRAVCDNIRNKTDEQIKAMAEKGGVIGIGSYTAWAYIEDGKRPTVDDYFKFVNYAVKLVGVDYVGIGTDIADAYVNKSDAFTKHWSAYPNVYGRWIDEVSERMEGLEHIEHYPSITMGLVANGYSDDDIRKIMGDNVLRVFRRVFGK